jgi:hypothetical protein
MTTLGVQRVVDGALASADSASLTLTDANNVTILTAIVPPASTGLYSYDSSYLQPGEYTATWTFAVAGQQNDVVYKSFTIDPVVTTTKGVTLADVERAIAVRVGPYYRYPASAGSTLNDVLIRRLRSTIDSGDYEDLWILRRGVLSTGQLAPSFNVGDRQRQIDEYVPAFGSLTPDRDWSVAPLTNEMIELHYLDPEQLLRPIAQAALRRCFFWDTAIIANVTTTNLREMNVTNVIPWITRKDQVRNVEFGRLNQMRTRLMYWKSFQSGPDVYLQVPGLPVGDLRITALRPHSTLVNGETSYVGPDDDDDILNVDLNYAAAAGHIEAWKQATPLLTPIAAEGLAIPMKLAANEFTKESMAFVRNEPELIQLAWGEDTTYLDQVGNA